MRAYGDSDLDDDATTDDVNESRLYGDEASITASSWPIVASATFDPTTVEEVDDATTADDAENESVLTITMSNRAFEAYNLLLSVADDDHAGLVSFASRVTVPRGQDEVEVTITAVNDDKAPAVAGATSTSVKFEVELAPAEAEDRDAFDAGSLTINDDETATTPPVTPPGTPTTSALSAPPNLAIASSASVTLNLSWGHVDFGSLESPGYQFRQVDSDPTLDDWGDATSGPAGGTQVITAGLQNGRKETFWVRAIGTDPEAIADPAVDDLETLYVNEETGVTYGDSAMVSGTPWPDVTAAFAPTSIMEAAGDDADNPANESTLTISVAGQVYQNFDVTVSVSVDGDDEAGNAGAVTFDKTQVPIPVGSSPSATIKVTAEDDPFAGEKAIVVDVKLVPVEAAGREPVESNDLTITDATDVAPVAPTNVAVGAPTVQTLTSSTRSVTWDPYTGEWGSGDEATRRFEYRTYDQAGTAPGADDGWMPAGGSAAISVPVTLTRPAATEDDITYAVEVRAVTQAGPGTADTATVTETAP